MPACVAPEKLVGYGSLLQYLNPLTDDWVTVGGTTDLALPTRSRGMIDTTDGQSGGWETNIPGPLKKQEPISYDVHFLSSQWFVLYALFEDGLMAEWRVVLMDERQFYYKFCATITNMDDEIPMTELVNSTIELSPTGGPTAGYLN